MAGRIRISPDVMRQRATVAAGGSARRRACDPLRPYNDAAWIEGRSYMFDSRLAAAVDEDGSVLYVACDELGSPTHVFDEAGALLQSYAYDEFGVQEEPCEGRLVPFGFAGYEIDGTGMLFAQARSYDPPTGRFCSEDVVRGDPARPQTLNRYAYCRGNPVGLVDRDGREAGSGNLLDMWDRFYQDNYGEDSSDITMPTLGTVFGLYQGGRTVTNHTGGGIFVKIQDTIGSTIVSVGGMLNIPGTLGVGYHGGINGYGLDLSFPANPILQFFGFDGGIDASVTIGGPDIVSADIDVHVGNMADQYGLGLGAGLGSVVQLYDFHDFASGPGERTRDQAGAYINTVFAVSIAAAVLGLQAGSQALSTSLAPGLEPGIASFSAVGSGCSLK